jgi:uncharacterized protein
MNLENIIYYKKNNLLIYPKHLSGHSTIHNAKKLESKVSFVTSSEDSSLKIDLNGLIYIQEIEKYNIECTDHSLTKNDFKIIGEFHSPNLGTLQYINYVGITNFSGLKLYILNKKIKETEYQWMVSEIEKKVTDLIFDFNKPTYLSTKTNVGTKTSISYHSFRLLLFLLETPKHEQNIYRNLNIILRNFHDKIGTQITEANFYEASDLDEESISSLVAESTNYTSYNNSNFSNNALVRYIKEKSGKDLIPTTYKKRSITFNKDNHENKFIKFFLKQCILILDYYKKKYNGLSKDSLVDHRILTQVDGHLNKLNYILNSNPLREIGDLNYIPFESQVLTKQDGYRQIFKSFLILKSRHSSLFNDEINHFIDSKSIDKIYEIWCYFALVDHLELIYSSSSVSFVSYESDQLKKNIVSNDGNTHFFIQGNSELPTLKIYFKKSFSYPESYSQLFDPDITIEILDESEQLKNRVFFDAKFKLDVISGSFKSEDINKMHTYLDAISRSIGSYVLYPGTKNKIFPKPNNQVGVGAFRFKHGDKGNNELIDHLTTILKSLK